MRLKMRNILLLWHILKLEVLIVYSCAYSCTTRRKYLRCKILSSESIVYFWNTYRKSRHYIASYRKEFVKTKHLVLCGRPFKSVANIFYGVIATAWLCEKMQVNLKIEGLPDFFENNVIINNPSKYNENHFEYAREFFAGKADIVWVGEMYIDSEYGYKILQKMPIKKQLIESADEWFNDRIKGDWVAVHYRGTDVQTNPRLAKRKMSINLYITWLKEVLDNQCSIFICSDQAQFIDTMYSAFPERVFARDIDRSYDDRPIHRDLDEGVRQKKDAFIDMLILAKANFVYTTGSGFVDVTRFLNPSIKIAALDGRWLVKSFSMGRNSSDHGMPIPRKDLLKRHHNNYSTLLD